ncbi:MAG: prephenate dehydratase, partial [Chloroflexi bacterium]|nr:prephenate dehydratase [Chloroflexota bacterium]
LDPRVCIPEIFRLVVGLSHRSSPVQHQWRSLAGIPPLSYGEYGEGRRARRSSSGPRPKVRGDQRTQVSGQEPQPDAAELQRLREVIDRLDGSIVRLLQERAMAARTIGAIKAAVSRGVYAPDREREVVDRVGELGSEGPLRREHLVAIYRQIISACRDLEQPLRVAYLGPAATFTHQAALEEFGETTTLIPVESIPDAFAETQRGRVDFGVVPVENSTEGPVNLTLDSFVDSDAKVCSEIVLPISLQLLGRADRDEIETIYSNPVALAQCREWIARHLPGRRIVDAVSTARAAMMAAEDATGAAIAPRLAAAAYGLNIVARDIQDAASNYTRFYVVAADARNQPTGRDKTAILFSIRDHVGALRDVADVFARHHINMNAIQSRPSRRRAWDYVFFVELGGHESDQPVRDALGELDSHCLFVKVLGSWPLRS